MQVGLPNPKLNSITSILFAGFPQKLFTNFQPVDPLNCSGCKTCITTKLLHIPEPFGIIRRLTASHIDGMRYGRNFFFAASFSGR